MKKPFVIVLRLLGLLLVLGLVAFGAFRFGYARGVAESPAIAAQIQALQSADPAAAAPYAFAGPMMMRAYQPHFFWHRPFGFFPFAGLLGFLFLVVLFFGMLRMMFFRGWRHAHGPWGGHMPPWGPPPDSRPDDPQGGQQA